MMQLLWSPNSPYVRKVLLVAYEVGIADRLKLVDTAANAIERDLSILAHNPLGQIPTLIREDGTALADSSVICDYLNQLGSGSMIAQSGEARWQALSDQALADGLATAALTIRYETSVRPSQAQWQGWVDAQQAKINTTLDYFNQMASSFGPRFDVGLAALAAALFYVDLRFPNMGWRDRAPALAVWYEAIQTRPSVEFLNALTA